MLAWLVDRNIRDRSCFLDDFLIFSIVFDMFFRVYETSKGFTFTIRFDGSFLSVLET